MVKKLKGKASESQVNENIVDFARLIWLAGLGAFAKAETEGGKLFEALVKEGEDVEARTRKIADETVESVKSKVDEMKGLASDRWDKLEEMFEDRVSRVLNRLGVPTKEDIEELSRRVEALNKNIKKLDHA
jgi:poly(hydroxyalkanoate) granule-associated protein